MTDKFDKALDEVLLKYFMDGYKRGFKDGYEAGELAEREEIAKIFDVDSHLVDFARNDKGGCLICGFTPKVAVQSIRARGEA